MHAMYRMTQSVPCIKSISHVVVVDFSCPTQHPHHSRETVVSASKFRHSMDLNMMTFRIPGMYPRRNAQPSSGKRIRGSKFRVYKLSPVFSLFRRYFP
ncbi:hypothetical protein VTN02DRAFT_68 [Thermoascus thermophilus]